MFFTAFVQFGKFICFKCHSHNISLGYQTSDSDIDDDELENLLDEGLPDDLRDRKKDIQYEERFKTVLEGIAMFITCK